VGKAEKLEKLEKLQPAQRTSLSDDIVKQITTLIASGVLKPGERIPSEKQLCQRFQVSRASVREALRSLSVLGILESHAGDGTFVAGDSLRYMERAFQWGMLLDRRAIEDLLETRLMLESHTASLAARKATQDDIRELAAAVRGMEEAVSDPQRYLEYDLKFHLRLAQASQNAILKNLVNTIRGYLEAWIRQALMTPGRGGANRRATLSVAQHRKILRAVERGRPSEARRTMMEHIRSSSAEVQRHIPLPPASGAITQ